MVVLIHIGSNLAGTVDVEELREQRGQHKERAIVREKGEQEVRPVCEETKARLPTVCGLSVLQHDGLVVSVGVCDMLVIVSQRNISNVCTW